MRATTGMLTLIPTRGLTVEIHVLGKMGKLGWGIRMAFEIHFHFDSIKYYHIRQQKPNPTNLTEEIDQKPPSLTLCSI